MEFNIPSKMGFFAWEAWWDKVLTMSNLERRGIPLQAGAPYVGKLRKISITY